MNGSSWRTASCCDAGACVETGTADGAVLVRDSTSKALVLAFSAAAWTAFTTAVKEAS